MNCIVIIGMTGEGKSEIVKSMIAGVPCFAFDVQDEYKDLSLNPADTRARHTELLEKKFVKQALQRINSVIVFEEATGFFEGRLLPEVRRLILSKRHKNNTLIFCFHSISAVPPRLMQMTNFVVLFKTGDELYQVKEKFPSLLSYFEQVKTLPKHGYLTIKMIPQ